MYIDNHSYHCLQFHDLLVLLLGHSCLTVVRFTSHLAAWVTNDEGKQLRPAGEDEEEEEEEDKSGRKWSILRKERLIHFWTENISNRHLGSSSVDLIYVNFSVCVATLEFCLVKSQKRQREILNIYNWRTLLQLRLKHRPCSWVRSCNKAIYNKLLLWVLEIKWIVSFWNFFI